jgi:hypothetical protein
MGEIINVRNMREPLLILITLFLLSCSNEDDSLTKINNDGTGGISCTINGKILRSKGLPYGNPKEYFGFANDGDIFYFAVGFHNRSSAGVYKNIRVQVYDVAYQNPLTLEKLSLEGNTYQLGEYGDPNLYGQYKTFGLYMNDHVLYNTKNIMNGEITITHHDIENYVISGTFWYDAINENGEIIKVRNGRFDKIIEGL